jgi:pyrroloquinoline quinone biosynthesis protein B
MSAMNPFAKYLSVIATLFSGSSVVPAADASPYLFILGVVQDVGYPQSGCYEPHCMPGWQDARRRRGAVSLGLIDPATNRKYLFEATPDFPAQLYKLEVEAPTSRFEFGGIFLTHAHIGHYTGLMYLGREAMGANNVPVYAMPRMGRFLTSNGPWSQLVAYQNIVLKQLANEQSQSFGQLTITPFLVPHRDEYSETVGFRIAGPKKTAIFIPDINKWSRWETDIVALIKSVDYALLDATFFADGELPGRDMSKIPHPLVTETMQTLHGLAQEDRQKVWFIHMNHTNPLLDSESTASKLVRSQSFNVAVEGIRLYL